MQIQPFSQRVLSRLADAIADEPDPWLRDDLKIAKLLVLHAARSDAVCCSPHELACYEVLGCHPSKVWPRIQAQRLALLGPSEAPPKKPAQSVKLWFEKTNAVRVSGSYGAMQFGSSRPTISVPMAAPSIAALYPNSDAPSSAKKRGYSLSEMKLIVGYSGAPDPTRDLTISALRARGEWPNEDGPATTVLSVAIIGMMLESCRCRSTIQRRIKRAVQLGYWRRVAEANTWTSCPQCGSSRRSAKCEKCNYRGRSKGTDGKWTGEFMRVPAYEFDIEKFRTAQRCREIRHFDARTYAEYKAAAHRGEHPNVTEMPARKVPESAPPPKSPAPATPLPQREKPAAEHRGTTRPPAQPKLTRRECARLVADVVQVMKGHTHHTERVGGLGFDLDPGDRRYRAPVSFQTALAEVCDRWKREVDSVRDAIKFWGYRIDEPS